MTKNEDDEIRCIAKEIKQYLGDHSNAADTLEGITVWWLFRQGFEAPKVQQALDYLVDISEVEVKTNFSDKKIYLKKRVED